MSGLPARNASAAALQRICFGVARDVLSRSQSLNGAETDVYAYQEHTYEELTVPLACDRMQDVPIFLWVVLWWYPAARDECYTGCR
jgi:hypothetical protein